MLTERSLLRVYRPSDFAGIGGPPHPSRRGASSPSLPASTAQSDLPLGRQRLSHARRAAEQAGAVVVLKGDDTLVVEPDGRVAIGRGDSPALATAGTGDVLTGTVAALLAQGLEALTAAAAAVQLHAQAGREAARRQGSAEGVIAGDVIAALPGARRA